MNKRTRRLWLVLGGLASVGVASALVLNAFQSNLVFFYTPTQVSNNEAHAGLAHRPFRRDRYGPHRPRGL
jgi:cytochrome c-type biogenesis protein CcmE